MIVTSFEIRGQDEGAVVRRFDDIRKAAADARREMEGAAEAFRRLQRLANQAGPTFAGQLSPREALERQTQNAEFVRAGFRHAVGGTGPSRPLPAGGSVPSGAQLSAVIDDLIKRIGPVATAISAVASAAASVVDGLSARTTTVFGNQARLQGLGDLTQIDTLALQGLQLGARQRGIGAQTFTTGLQVASVRLAEAREKGQDLLRLSDQVSLRLKDDQGRLLGNFELLQSFAGAIDDLSPDQQTIAAAALLGEEYAGLVALFRDGKAGLAGLAAELERIDGVIDKDIVAKAAEANKAIASAATSLSSGRDREFLATSADEIRDVADAVKLLQVVSEKLGKAEGGLVGGVGLFGDADDDPSSRCLRKRLEDLLDERARKSTEILEEALKNATKSAGLPREVMEALDQAAKRRWPPIPSRRPEVIRGEQDLRAAVEETTQALGDQRAAFEALAGPEGRGALHQLALSGEVFSDLPPLLTEVGEAAEKAGPAVADLLPAPDLLDQAAAGLESFAGTAEQRFSETADRLQDGLGQTILDIFNGASPKAALKNFTRFAKASFSGLLQDLAQAGEEILAALRNPIVTRSGRVQGCLQPA